MAKTLVVESGEHPEKIPFLRGILTRSLQKAGLSFEEAYAVAAAVRDEISPAEEITTSELRRKVDEHIAKFGPAFRQRYLNPPTVSGTILVRGPEGETSQFSRQRHRRVLESSGLSYEESTVVTTAIFGYLLKKGWSEIEARRLGLLTYRYLRLIVGPEAAHRYLVMVNHFRREQPILIMIGGAPGTGKSALATELAQRLEIVRTQSTDLLREVMRMMVPERLLPVLHRSSYDAWQALPRSGKTLHDAEDLLVDGYRAQAELLTVPCEAVVKRSLREQTSLIIEGVHVQPSLLEKVPESEDAIAITITLAVLNRQKLQERFLGRGAQIDARRAERYLEHFDSIWRLQSYLLSEADQEHTPIIINDHKEQVIHDVMVTVVDRLAERFSATPEEVFG
jgi:2-phosphoglycerate kinase